MTRQAIQEALELSDREHFANLSRARCAFVEQGVIEMTARQAQQPQSTLSLNRDRAALAGAAEEPK